MVGEKWVQSRRDRLRIESQNFSRLRGFSSRIRERLVRDKVDRKSRVKNRLFSRQYRMMREPLFMKRSLKFLEKITSLILPTLRRFLNFLEKITSQILPTLRRYLNFH